MFLPGAGHEGKLPFFELTQSRASSKKFFDLIGEARNANKYGAAVTQYNVVDYENCRLFVTGDGNVGFALKGDDIISVFKNPASTEHNIVPSVMALAVQQGGRRLDCFDTVLPDLYSFNNFRAVARVAWNDEYAPPLWDKKVFADFNGGKPDVVFMIYDPTYNHPYDRSDGALYDSYAEAQKAQIAALHEAKEASGPALTNAPMASQVVMAQAANVGPGWDFGHDVEVLVNPTMRDVIALGSKRYDTHIRVIRDYYQNIYVWRGEAAIHVQMIRSPTFDGISFDPDEDAYDGMYGEQYTIKKSGIIVSGPDGDYEPDYLRDGIKAGQANAKKAANRMQPELRYNPYHDEEGKFTTGGGEGGGGGATKADKATSKKIGAASDSKHVGTKKTLGSGYSAEAKLVGDTIHTTNVNDAVRALYEGRKVELAQPRQVATLVDKLGQITADMVKKGEKAPTFDLCNVSVEGTNLFCAESKGIPRIKMPQLDRKQTKAFIKYLKKEGYKAKKAEELSDHLRATQNQLDGAKVAQVVAKVTANPDKRKRLIVSRDNYILDGHHHWAADIYQAAKEDDLFEHTTDVTRVDIDIITLLEEADKFTGGKGRKGVGADDRGFDPHIAFFMRGETDAVDCERCQGAHQEGGHAGEAGEVGEDSQCGA